MAKLKNIPGIGALHGSPADSAPVHDNSNGAVSISDLGILDKINLRTRVDNAAIRTALVHIVGPDLPTEFNTFTQTGERMIIWLGPDEWLLLSENGSAEEIIADLDTDDAGHIAITNISDALGVLALEGVHARDVLAKHCALDFHPSVFTIGMTAQSLISHAGVTIICRDEDSFMLIARSSFMAYLLDLIKDASLEYGFSYKPA
jgi:sarcosine oxidase subunit gamma